VTPKAPAWSDPKRRASKRQKYLLDIIRLIEAHPALKAALPAKLQSELPENL
jgi:hypothetical protein